MPQTVFKQMSGGNGHATVIVGKQSTFKILNFDGTGLWEQYYKQYEPAGTHNQWSDTEKAVAVTVHLKGATRRCSQQCPQVKPSSMSHLLNVWSRDLDKNTLFL